MELAERPRSTMSDRASNDGEPSECQSDSGEDLLERRGRKMVLSTWLAKYTLFVINFILFLIGAVLLSLGVWVYFGKNSFVSALELLNKLAQVELDTWTQPVVLWYLAIILIIVGGALFILSFLGYIAPLRESKCLLGTYGTIILLMVLGQIAAISLAFIFRDWGEGEIRKHMKYSINDYRQDAVNGTNMEVTLMWNNVMNKFSCCGVDNYTDFSKNQNYLEPNVKVPRRCCKFTNGAILDPSCPENATEANSYYMTGCYQVIANLINDHLDIVIYVIIGIIVAELTVMLLAFCLCKAVEDIDDI